MSEPLIPLEKWLAATVIEGELVDEDPSVRQWQVGDKAAVKQLEDGRYVYASEAAARKLGVTEDTPGWRFVEVVDG
jgi:hypothetical protein